MPLPDKAYSWFSSTIPASWLRALGKANIPIYRATGGRVLGTVGKAPVLLLTTTGRKSGQPRTAPLVYLDAGDRLVVIGSNAGNTNTPAWALNLVANPEAEVEIRGRRRPVLARVAEGEERERLWREMNQHYSGFDDYVQLTNRDIRVFVLEPR